METWRFATLFRLGLTNVTAAALIFAAWNAGFLTAVYNSDHFYVAHLMVAVFLFGTYLTVRRAISVSHTLNTLSTSKLMGDLKILTNPAARANFMTGEKVKVSHRLRAMKALPSMLLMLGLFGTVAGFMEGLHGVSADSVSDMNALPAMVGGMLAGMFAAFSKTLIGIGLYLWLGEQIKAVNSADTSIISRATKEAELWHASLAEAYHDRIYDLVSEVPSNG